MSTAGDAILAQAQQIADLVAAVPEFRIVYPAPRSTVETNSAVVSPAPEWGSFTDGTFCDPIVQWEIIVIAPSQTDWSQAMSWLFARAADLAAIDDLAVDDWTQPERIALNASGAEGLAVRVQLAPRPLDLTAGA